MLRRSLRVRDAAAVAGVAALVVGLPALANGFTYDDVWLVQNHPVVRAPAGLRALLTATVWPPTDGVGALWRPLTLAAFAAQWALGGGSPLLFHGVTVVLSAVTAALVAGVGGALFGPVVALVAGLLFAVHPVHVEVTATVVGQAELLAAVAYLGALWAAWRASERSASPWWSALAAAAMLAGLGAKEHVITLPAVLLPLWWWRSVRDARPAADVARRQAPLLLTTLVIALAYLLVRRTILGDAAHAGAVASGLDPTSAAQRALVMLPISLRWLELLFAPLRLSADYSPQHVIPNATPGPLHAAALAAWVAIAALAWRGRRLIPAAAFGTAFFALTIAIVSNVPVPLEVLLAERLLFLPSVGWAMAMGGLVAWVATSPGAPRRRAKTALTALAALTALLFAIRSLARAPVWRSNTVLFAQMLREAPRSFRTHWALGAEAFARGDSVAGEQAWREAIRLNPDHPQPLEDLGRLYARTGRWEPAIPLLERVVLLDSTRIGAALALTTGLTRTGEYAKALGLLDALERRDEGDAMLMLLRADVLRRTGDDDRALAAAEEAVARDSTAWRIWVFAAETAVRAGRCGTAAELAAGARRWAGDPDREAVEAALAGVANREGSCK
jgi:hypothetical protein